ncbi:MAG: hypothetical protein PHH47_08680 [Gallionella sp.]|nr:hypothetical protein [Gallionella sp.]MDD4945879.1 hypothetical protein [Gallionella sp.]MDD5612082.1 hypothetical protein [Gallionella sp.]
MTTLSKENRKKERYNTCSASRLRRKELIADAELEVLLDDLLMSLTPLKTSSQTASPMDFYEAVVIFLKHMEASQPDAIAPQPNKRLSKLIKGIWYLRNTNGLLARIGTIKKQVFMPATLDYSRGTPIQREFNFPTLIAG